MKLQPLLLAFTLATFPLAANAEERTLFSFEKPDAAKREVKPHCSLLKHIVRLLVTCHIRKVSPETTDPTSETLAGVIDKGSTCKHNSILRDEAMTLQPEPGRTTEEQDQQFDDGYDHCKNWFHDDLDSLPDEDFRRCCGIIQKFGEPGDFPDAVILQCGDSLVK